MSTVARLIVVAQLTGNLAVQRGIAGIGSSAAGAQRSVSLLNATLGALAALGIGKVLGGYIDTFIGMENKLKVVVSDWRNLGDKMAEVQGIARRSRSDIDATVKLYQRTGLAVRQLGRDENDVSKFTETLSKAISLSGASAQEAQAAMIQLSQGLSKGVLNGDELRSVLEQLPFVADLIAKKMNVTRGELRKLGREGKITSTIILDAVIQSGADINTLFDATKVTIGQAFTVLNSSLLFFVGSLDAALGSSTLFNKIILFIADNIGVIATAALPIFANLLIGLGRTILPMLITQFGLLNTVMAASPLGRMSLIVVTLVLTLAQMTGGIDRLKQVLIGLGVAWGFVFGARALQSILMLFPGLTALRLAFTGLTLGAYMFGTISVKSFIATSLAALATAARLGVMGTIGLLAGRAVAAGATIAGVAWGGFMKIFSASGIGFIINLVGLIIAALVSFADKIKMTGDDTRTLKDVMVDAWNKIGTFIVSVINKIIDGINAMRKAWAAWMEEQYSGDIDHVSFDAGGGGGYDDAYDRLFGGSGRGTPADDFDSSDNLQKALDDSKLTGGISDIGSGVGSLTDLTGAIGSDQIGVGLDQIDMVDSVPDRTGSAVTKGLAPFFTTIGTALAGQGSGGKTSTIDMGRHRIPAEALRDAAQKAAAYKGTTAGYNNIMKQFEAGTITGDQASYLFNQLDSAVGSVVSGNKAGLVQLTHQPGGESLVKAIKNGASGANIQDFLDPQYNNGYLPVGRREQEAGQYLPGFKTGGQFDIPGMGGADSKLVQFWGSPGERVKISRNKSDEDDSGSRGERPIIVHFNVSSPDPNSFKKTQRQIAQDLANLIKTAGIR